MRLLPVLATAAALAMLHACGIAGPADSSIFEEPPADFEVLLVGNSHSSRNDLPSLVARIIEASEPGRSAHAYAVPRWALLAERLDDGVTQNSLDSRPRAGLHRIFFICATNP